MRITPADAGKTEYYAFPDEETGDHPRGCGENAMLVTSVATEIGSPPRMRGKLNRSLKRHSRDRITPADAGKTPETVMKWWLEQDHPRGCGENSILRKGRSARLGSPPRMRGKLGSLSRNHVPTRITPADAGKTRYWASFSVDFGDHPRGCGENAFGLSQALSLSGSPPRMRGKPDMCHSAF